MMDRYGDVLERNWWLLLIRGIAAIVFGLAAFAWPGLTVAVLVLMFGAYVLVDGVSGLIDSIRYRERLQRWWLWALDGLLGLVVGLITLFMPGVTAFVLLLFIAAWAIAGGVLRIIAAVQLRREIEGEWLLVLGGALSVLFGILLVAVPAAGVLSLVWLIGAYAIAFGVIMIMHAFRLRKAGKERSSSQKRT